jgi:glycosyltransferase involved in cell wall biosynthesis
MRESIMRFSIITAVYKGSKFLPKLFADLIERYKTFPDFEWILVDDCSDDNGASRAEMEKIKNSHAPFIVKTFYLTENYYAAMCTYSGSLAAEGEYIIILDQDDLLSPDGLNIFDKYITKYSNKEGFVGVCGRCLDARGEFIGDLFKENEVYSNELYVRHVLRIRGEMFQCTKTEVIRKYFKGMLPGFTNGWAWSRISLDYSWLYTNEVVRCYDTQNPESFTNSPFRYYSYNVCKARLIELNTMKNYIFSNPIYWSKLLLGTSFLGWQCGVPNIGKDQPLFIKVPLALCSPLGAFRVVLNKIAGKKIYLKYK